MGAFGWRILVCGGRKWVDRSATFAALTHAQRKAVEKGLFIEAIIHGATIDMRWGRSADWLADDWAREVGIRVERYPVDVMVDGPWPAAGHRRNARMLQSAWPVHGGIAFSGQNGTAGMIRLMHDKGLQVWEPFG